MGDWKKVEAQLRKTINDINVVTEGNDTNIVDGVNRLIRGYEGSGDSENSFITSKSIATGFILEVVTGSATSNASVPTIPTNSTSNVNGFISEEA